MFIIEGSGTVMDTFALKAYGTVRPGDDILLNFELVDYDVPALEVLAGDFLASYDKKLVWRAELYVDEGVIADTGADSGETDWNGINTWAFTQENTWDTSGNGHQFDLESWTRFDDSAGSDRQTSDRVCLEKLAGPALFIKKTKEVPGKIL